MTPSEQRPIHKDDYWRAYALLQASEWAFSDEDTDIFDALLQTHERYLQQAMEGPLPMQDGDTMEEFVSREFKHAFILLESLTRDEDTMPVRISAGRECALIRGARTLLPGSTASSAG